MTAYVAERGSTQPSNKTVDRGRREAQGRREHGGTHKIAEVALEPGKVVGARPEVIVGGDEIIRPLGGVARGQGSVCVTEDLADAVQREEGTILPPWPEVDTRRNVW